MRVIHTLSELEGKKVCLAIGFFDGVHLGHQQIIRQMVSQAQQHESASLVLTFDQHPNTIVAPNRVPPLIYSLNQKIRAIEALGPDALWLIHFDRAFSEQSGEEFIRGLVPHLALVRIFVGAAFVFGRKRSGNVELLKRLGQELNFSVHGMAAVSLDGEPVSSTRIRQAIQAGDLAAASQMLGRAYSLAGTVIKGDGLGRQIGFPTANLDVSGLALPPNGVYAVQASVGGKQWRALVNIGLRPTLRAENPRRQVEVHLLGFNGDLYERELEITFVEKLREEQKFPSLADLREQIKRDIALAEVRI